MESASIDKNKNEPDINNISFGEQHLSPPQTSDWFRSNKFAEQICKEIINEYQDVPLSSELTQKNSNHISHYKGNFVKQNCLKSQADVGEHHFLERQVARKSTIFEKAIEFKNKINFKKRKSVCGAEILILKNKVIANWLETFRLKRKWQNPDNLNKWQMYLLGGNLLGSENSNSSLKKHHKKPCIQQTRETIFYKAFFRRTLWYLVKQMAIKIYLGSLILASKMPVINPESRFKIIWNIFICLCIPYQLFNLTIEIFFDSNWKLVYGEGSTIFVIVEQILIYLFLFDLLMNFFTGFYEKGNIIYNNRKIIKNYVSKFLLIDVLTLLPLFLDRLPTELPFFSRKSIFFSFLRLLFVFRLLNLTRTFSLVEQILSNRKKLEVLLALVKLGLYIIGTAHMLACMWYFIGMQSARNKYPSWVQNTKICAESCDWRNYYIYSLYWAITTMITVGYGDITPTNEVEVGYCLISMIFGCGMFGYSINKIGNVFEKLRSNEKCFNEKMKLINRYMNREQVDFDLQVRVRRYLEYIFMEAKNEKSEEEQKIIKHLSTSLRKELLMQTNGKLMMMNPIFANNFSKSSIEKFSELFKQQDFAHEEIVFEEKSQENDKLYFISKGRVDTFIECDNGSGSYIRLRSLNPGSVLGEIPFFTSTKHNFTAVSVGFTRVFYVNKASFMDVLREEPEDYERFCLMRDKLINYRNSEDFYHPCICCDKTDHIYSECPLIHYQPNRLNVALRTKKKQKDLNRYQRKPRVTTSSLKDIKKVQEAGLEFRMENDISVGSCSEEQSCEETFKPIDRLSTVSQISKEFIRLGSNIENEKQQSKGTKGADLEASKLFNGNFLSVESPVAKLSQGFQREESSRREELPLFQGSRQTNSDFSEALKHSKSDIDPSAGVKKDDSAAQIIKIENDIDRIKDFKTYFPYNNSIKIVRKMNDKRKVKTSGQREIIAYNRNMIKELLDLHKNYSIGLFLKQKKSLNKAKFNFQKNDV